MKKCDAIQWKTLEINPSDIKAKKIAEDKRNYILIKIKVHLENIKLNDCKKQLFTRHLVKKLKIGIK